MSRKCYLYAAIFFILLLIPTWKANSSSEISEGYTSVPLKSTKTLQCVDFIASSDIYSNAVSKTLIRTSSRISDIKYNVIKQNHPFIKDSIVNTTIQYYSYEIMKEDLLGLNKKYGKLFSINSLGKSFLGRDIPVIIFGKGQRKKFLIVGGIHGREYITTQLIMRQLEEYLKNFNNSINGINIKKLTAEVSFYFIPSINPDGAELSQFGIKTVNNTSIEERLLAINKQNSDFSRWKANANAVDLNRNFPVGWAEVPVIKPASEQYKGVSPLSEAESKLVANYIKQNNFDGLISYHATGSIIYWYNNQTGKRFNDDLRIAKEIARITNYSLVKSSNDNLEGGLKDWFIPTFNKPGLTIEVGKGKECPLKISEFMHIWNENKIVPLTFAKLILNSK